MKFETKRGRLLASTMIGGAVAAMAVPAFAQEAQTTVKEVVVTGSRIPKPNNTATSPVETVTSQEFKLEGTVDAESLLNNLPQVSPSATQFSNNGATGIATVDLRGFGPVRTLVLVDGRRMPPGDATAPVADLNLIPSSLVDSVDVLTGGAASIYGSDAISGVVNFKLKHNFEGLQIDAQYDFAQHDNNNSAADAVIAAAHRTAPTGSTIQGRTTHVNITFGANSADGKGNLEGYLGYINQEPVRQAAYDYAFCALGNTYAYGVSAFGHNSVTLATGHSCSGSSNSAYGKFQGKFYGAKSGTNWVSSNTLNNTTQTLSNNPGGANFVTYSSAPPGAVNRTWNYAPFQYFMRQDTRYQGGYFAHYDINEHMTAYSDFMFEQDASTGQLAPSGLFANNGPINSFNCGNPLMTAAQQQAVCGPNAGNTGVMSGNYTIGYRLQNVPRDFQLFHSSYKMDEGLKGALDDAWSYDIYMQYGRTDSSQKTVGDVSKARIANALNAIPNGSGGAMCASASARAAGCVPLNIFQPLSAGIPLAAFNYIEEDATIAGYTTEQIVSGSVVGRLGKYGLKSPWANDGVGLAIGAEYRRDYLNSAPDAATTSGDLSGASVGGAQKVQGAINVKDIYGELSIPLVSDQFLMKDITLDASYRRSDYNLAGTSGTYKFGGDWAIDKNVRFRGAFARTERAPNVLELFLPSTIGNAAYSDACSGPVSPTTHLVASGYSAAQCYRSANLAAAMTETYFAQNIYGNISACPAGQCNAKVGGNSALKPEVADTTTLGAVFTPTFLRGFSASVDYWDILVKGGIGTLTASSVQNGCYQLNITTLCNDIYRDPGTGTLTGTQGFVQANLQNLNALHKRGWDVQMDYSFRLKDTGVLPDWGKLSTEFVGSYLVFDKTNQPVSGQFNCAGLFGQTCGQSDPRWRHKVRWTWATPWKVDVSLQWRYIAQVKADVDSSNPLLNGLNSLGALTQIDQKIPAYSYFDLAASWRIRDNLTLRGGVNNIFDKDPPVLDTTSFPLTPLAGNTYPGLYDPLGRTVFISLTAKY